MKNKAKNKKHLRLRDISANDCYMACEIRVCAESVSGNIPVTVKCGGKNYRIVSDRTIDGHLVFIGKRFN